MPYLSELYRTIVKNKKLRQTLSTKKLMTYVQEKNEILEEDRHQDCHEFYMWLINELNDEMIKKLKAQNPNYKSKDNPTPLEKDMFGLRTTRTVCMKCHTGTLPLN